MWIHAPQPTQAQRDKGNKMAAAMLEKRRKEKESREAAAAKPDEGGGGRYLVVIRNPLQDGAILSWHGPYDEEFAKEERNRIAESLRPDVTVTVEPDKRVDVG